MKRAAKTLSSCGVFVDDRPTAERVWFALCDVERALRRDGRLIDAEMLARHVDEARSALTQHGGFVYIGDMVHDLFAIAEALETLPLPRVTLVDVTALTVAMPAHVNVIADAAPPGPASRIAASPIAAAAPPRRVRPRSFAEAATP